MYVFQLFDYYLGSRIILLIAFFMCIAVAWVYGTCAMLGLRHNVIAHHTHEGHDLIETIVHICENTAAMWSVFCHEYWILYDYIGGLCCQVWTASTIISRSCSGSESIPTWSLAGSSWLQHTALWVHFIVSLHVSTSKAVWIRRHYQWSLTEAWPIFILSKKLVGCL